MQFLLANNFCSPMTLPTNDLIASKTDRCTQTLGWTISAGEWVCSLTFCSQLAKVWAITDYLKGTWLNARTDHWPNSARCSLPHCCLLAKVQVVTDYAKTRCSSLEVSLDMLVHFPITARCLNCLLTKLLTVFFDHCSLGCKWYLIISFEGTTPRNMTTQVIQWEIVLAHQLCHSANETRTWLIACSTNSVTS